MFVRSAAKNNPTINCDTHEKIRKNKEFLIAYLRVLSLSIFL
jgi:hypothetical protein